MADRCSISVGPLYLKVRFYLDETEDFWHALYDFKDLLPPYARAFNAQTKIWTVDKSYLEDVRRWANEWFDDVIEHRDSDAGQREEEQKGRPRYQEPNSNDPWGILWVIPGAPPEVIDAAYRALAKLNHPDLGGNTETMKSINLAYEKVRKQ